MKVYPFVGHLTATRKLQHLSIEDLAPLVGCEPETMGKWERGKAKPSLAAVDCWASALGYELTVRPKP